MTVLEAWEMQLKEENEYYVTLQGMSMEKRTRLLTEARGRSGRSWVLINYDALRATPQMAYLHWCAAILDESTAIKNPKAKISQLVCDGFRSCDHRIILSGLPSPEGDLDLFQQFKYLDGQFLNINNYYKFRSHYFEQTGMMDWNHIRNAKAKIKQEVHFKSFIVRRKDVGLDSKKIRETRSIDMLPEQMKAYKAVEKEYATWLHRGEVDVLKETNHVIVQRMWMQRIAGGCDAEGVPQWNPKVRELVNLLKGECSNQPVVVWFKFNSEIAEVSRALKKAGVSHRCLVGEHSREQRVEYLEWFRNFWSSSRVLLCQVKLARYGVDCSISDTAIYYSMTHSCEENAQSEDRIVHPINRSPLLYLYLVSRGTIDQDIMYAVNSKVTNAKMFMTKIHESMGKRSMVW